MSIKIGIAGYGNLGRGVEAAVNQAEDLELVAVFTRRDPASLQIASDVPVMPLSEVASMEGNIDVLVICGGSATDLPVMTPDLASKFNVIDSFDTHANIPQHFANVDAAAGPSGHVAIISCGWDPGYFSIARIYADAALPNGQSYTFWGRGVSQGHSDAIRRIEGVRDARQYTVPIETAVQRVRNHENPSFTAREMHLRECWVVAEDGADLGRIEREIVEMPNYFDEYDTTVNFISQEELDRDHAGLPHGGSVIRSGVTGNGAYNNTVEFRLDLDSNPYFTGSILAAAARAAYRMNQEGQSGARTLFDVPPAYLSAHSREELLAHML
ncbi:MAG: diaminopimelate dehydrogenase [Mogibacterium sp.]|nr:diaminopimelate dehydrogenase [Mogibacterium sp.]